MISEARQRVAVSANATITLLYWHIGERINREVLDNQRAEYGKRVIENVACQLQLEYGGREFSARNLRRMMQFAQLMSDHDNCVDTVDTIVVVSFSGGSVS